MADTFSQWSMNKWQQIKSKLFVAVFAVLIFAVMSNHYHFVVYVDESEAKNKKGAYSN